MPTTEIDPDYQRHGTLTLGRRLSDDAVAEAVAFFDDLDAADAPESFQPEFDGDGADRRLRKVRRLLWNDPRRWGPMLADAGIPALAEAVLGGGAAIVFHAAFLKPARIGTPTPLHQDQALWRHEYPGAFSVWFALTDVSPANGGLHGCPGSHRAGTRPHADRPEYPGHPSLDAVADGLGEPRQFDLVPGDAVMWDRNFAHGSAANTSDGDRRGMVVVLADASVPGFRSRDHFPVGDLASPAART